MVVQIPVRWLIEAIDNIGLIALRIDPMTFALWYMSRLLTQNIPQGKSRTCHSVRELRPSGPTERTPYERTWKLDSALRLELFRFLRITPHFLQRERHIRFATLYRALVTTRWTDRLAL